VTVLRSGSASDVGRVRTVNEDLALETVTLFAVADGMGGHAGGEVASRLAMDSLQGGFRRDPTASGLVDAVRAANEVVFDRSRHDPDLRGMGTTLTAAALVATDDGDRLVLANVGDSRAYRFGSGGLEQLTTDHSVAEELVARGELSEAEAAVHPHRHILTRALGVAPEVDVDAWEVQPAQGERYLLCSDGLTNEVSSDRITTVLSSTFDPQLAAETLVRMANEHGGNDNVTVVVVDVVVGDVDGQGTGTVTGTESRPASGTGGAVPPPPVDASAASAAGGTASAGAFSDGLGPRAGYAAGSASLAAGTLAAPGAPGGVGTLTAPPTSGEDFASERPPRRRRWRRRGQRRITFRSVFFVLLVGAVGYGAYSLINWYATNSYFVGIDRGQLVIYRGRPGGFLWTKPEVVHRTGVTTAEVPSQYLGDVRRGVQESSYRDAVRYVDGLRSYQRSLQPGTVPPGTTTSAPPGLVTTRALAASGRGVGGPTPIGAAAGGGY
jgi:protein phosphatase